MTKWLILLIVVVVFVGGWYYVSNNVRYTPPWMQPKFAKISKGDISVPISATGLIEPYQRIDVKSEASGEVLEVLVEEGDWVSAGDILVQIQKDDEQRAFERATQDLARANALLAQSKLAVDRAIQNEASAKARVAESEAQVAIATESLRYVEDRVRQEMASDFETVQARSQAKIAQAQLDVAKAAYATSQIAVSDARHAVTIQETAVQIAGNNLGDAQERLEETTVRAPKDGVVVDVNVTEGAVIQSATANFTGGTTLMQLADVSQLKVVTRVDEADYGRILNIAPDDALPQMEALERAAEQGAAEIESRAGTVEITVDAFPELIFEGVIERVEPQGQLAAGSSVIQFDVHVTITDERRRQLLLGSQAQVEFTVDVAKDALRAPTEAVKSHNDQRGVWVRVDPDPTTDEQWGKRFVAVAFGITDGAYTEIVRVMTDDATIDEGDEVYTKLPRTPDDR